VSAEPAAFLAARLEEDERIAMAATGQDWGQPAERPEHWRWECAEDDKPVDVDLAIASGQEILEHGDHYRIGLRSTEEYPSSVGPLSHLIIDGEEIRPQDARHIARHDPARVLREVAAGRQLLSDYEEARTSNAETVLVIAEILLMQIINRCGVYDSHPDYLPKWGPA
jgi:uncharacterized protein DUF6221